MILEQQKNGEWMDCRVEWWICEGEWLDRLLKKSMICRDCHSERSEESFPSKDLRSFTELALS
jgi:hypothetical protein